MKKLMSLPSAITRSPVRLGFAFKRVTVFFAAFVVFVALTAV